MNKIGGVLTGKNELTLNIPLKEQNDSKRVTPCPESLMQTQTLIPRTHRLPLCRVPGWRTVEAVTSLHSAGLVLATQVISQDYCFIHLSGTYLRAEDISGLQANPTGEAAWTPLANFPPGKKSEKRTPEHRKHCP